MTANGLRAKHRRRNGESRPSEPPIDGPCQMRQVSFPLLGCPCRIYGPGRSNPRSFKPAFRDRRHQHRRFPGAQVPFHPRPGREPVPAATLRRLTRRGAPGWRPRPALVPKLPAPRFRPKQAQQQALRSDGSGAADWLSPAAHPVGADPSSEFSPNTSRNRLVEPVEDGPPGLFSPAGNLHQVLFPSAIGWFRPMPHRGWLPDPPAESAAYRR